MPRNISRAEACKRYERDLQEDVIRCVKARWDKYVWVLKTHELVRVGVPDLIICFFGYFVAIELKRNTRLKHKDKDWFYKKHYPLQYHNIKMINFSGGRAFFGRTIEKIMEQLEELYKEVVGR